MKHVLLLQPNELKEFKKLISYKCKTKNLLFGEVAVLADLNEEQELLVKLKYDWSKLVGKEDDGLYPDAEWVWNALE